MASQITPITSGPAPAARPAPASVRNAPTRGPAAEASASSTQEAAVAQVNQHLEQTQTELKLQVDAESGRTVFQVVQQDTGEVVLQVPSAEVLGMSRRVRDLEGQAGGLLDKEG